MNNKLITATLLIAAVAVGFAAGRSMIFDGKVQPGESVSMAPSESVGVKINEVSINDNSDKFFNITGDYPQFTGMDAINGPIKAMVDSTLAEFKKSSRENWAAREATKPSGQAKQEFPDKPFDFVLTWQPVQINEKYVSLIVRIEYFNGGANMISRLETFNYDVANKKIVALADLFPGDANYLQKVSTFARQSLAASLGEINPNITDKDPMLAAGTEPKLENFQNFTITPFAINFYWAKYGVAAGSFGEQSVSLPLRDIPNLE